MLQIETGNAGNEEVGGLGSVLQAPDAVVAGSMFSVGGIVTDDGRQIADAERVMSHDMASPQRELTENALKLYLLHDSARRTLGMICSDRRIGPLLAR